MATASEPAVTAAVTEVDNLKTNTDLVSEGVKNHTLSELSSESVSDGGGDDSGVLANVDNAQKEEAFVASSVVSSKGDDDTGSTVSSPSISTRKPPPPPVAVAFDEPSVPAFLLKLYTILEDPNSDDIIGWSQKGDSFIVHNVLDFSNLVLPQFFKHSNFQSFIRQLNLYGFHKLKQAPDCQEFNHPLFKRAHKHRLKDIKRKIPANAKGKKAVAKQQKEQLLEKLSLARDEHMEAISNLKHAHTLAVAENRQLWKEVQMLQNSNKVLMERTDTLIELLMTSTGNKDSTPRGSPLRQAVSLNSTGGADVPLSQNSTVTAEDPWRQAADVLFKAKAMTVASQAGTANLNLPLSLDAHLSSQHNVSAASALVGQRGERLASAYGIHPNSLRSANVDEQKQQHQMSSTLLQSIAEAQRSVFRSVANDVCANGQIGGWKLRGEAASGTDDSITDRQENRLRRNSSASVLESKSQVLGAMPELTASAPMHSPLLASSTYGGNERTTASEVRASSSFESGTTTKTDLGQSEAEIIAQVRAEMKRRNSEANLDDAINTSTHAGNGGGLSQSVAKKPRT